MTDTPIALAKSELRAELRRRRRALSLNQAVVILEKRFLIRELRLPVIVTRFRFNDSNDFVGDLGAPFILSCIVDNRMLLVVRNILVFLQIIKADLVAVGARADRIRRNSAS